MPIDSRVERSNSSQLGQRWAECEEGKGLPFSSAEPTRSQSRGVRTPEGRQGPIGVDERSRKCACERGVSTTLGLRETRRTERSVAVDQRLLLHPGNDGVEEGLLPRYAAGSGELSERERRQW